MIFDKYSQFIDSDPRVHRPGFGKGYNVNHSFMEDRFTAYFHEVDLQGKSVLDLGACVGSLGAWVLASGASHYCAVDLSDDFCKIATENLTAHFPTDKWSVHCTSIEDFVSNTSTHYDVIVASGIIYGFYNPIDVLNQIAEIGNTIIIESQHPRREMLGLPGLSDRVWSKVLYESAIILYQPFMMINGTTHSNKVFDTSLVSPGFLRSHFTNLGFSTDLSINERLCQKLPNLYAIDTRFAMQFDKQIAKKAQGFVEALQANDISNSANQSWHHK